MVEPRIPGEVGFADWVLHLVEMGLCGCEGCGGHLVEGGRCGSCGCTYRISERRSGESAHVRRGRE